MADILMLPENQKQLMLMIRFRFPALYARLRGLSFEEQLALLCTEANIVIDATCTPADMARLFDTLYEEYSKKSIIIVQ